jgi:hypothetical protein
MKYLAAVAALLASTPAHAETYAEFVKTLFPPPQYDKPYPGRLVENRAIDMEDMAKLCAPHAQAGTLLGCSIKFMDSLTGAPRICFIYIAPDWFLAKSGVSASQIRRHEIGHCNGWPQSHPAE